MGWRSWRKTNCSPPPLLGDGLTLEKSMELHDLDLGCFIFRDYVQFGVAHKIEREIIKWNHNMKHGLGAIPGKRVQSKNPGIPMNFTILYTNPPEQSQHEASSRTCFGNRCAWRWWWSLDRFFKRQDFLIQGEKTWLSEIFSRVSVAFLFLKLRSEMYAEFPWNLN